MPLVSIVMPLFNMASTLPASIDSCLDQTMSDFELLLIDDGSRQATALIATQLADSDPRINYRRIEHTGNPSRVRNIGIRAATGVHVQFLDADDLITQDKLEQQLDALGGSRINTIAYTDYLMFWEERGHRRFERLGPAHAEHWPGNLAKQFSMYTVLHRFLFPRQVLLTHGGFDERLTHSEDLDLWLRLQIRGMPFIYQPEPLAWYRQHVSHSLRNPQAEVSSRLQVASNCETYLAEAGLADRYKQDLATIAALARRPAWATVAPSDS